MRAKDGEKLQELDELYAALMQRQAVKIAHQQVAELLRVAAEPYKKLQDEVHAHLRDERVALTS